jgi:hypothetical protein
MPIRDLAGTGALQESLATTNTHLEAVLDELQASLGATNTHLAAVLGELQELNGTRLQAVVTELHSLNAKVDRLVEQGGLGDG